MVVKRLGDPAAFLAAAGPLLLQDEARHNLALSIAATLRDHPAVYPEHHLWVVADGGRTVGAALQTPPFNLVVARPSAAAALGALAATLHAERSEIPGVTGADPEATTFADAWSELTGVRRRTRMTQRIYRLSRLRPMSDVPGRSRLATEADRPLLVSWLRAFADEALGDVESPVRSAERTVDARLGEGTGGFLLWEDGKPVSLAGWGAPTPNGVRIGPVYTPP